MAVRLITLMGQSPSNISTEKVISLGSHPSFIKTKCNYSAKKAEN